MPHHVHHVHIFASDVNESIRFYQEYFGARVVFDGEMAGARNVFLRIGNGRIHLYDQPPKQPGRGGIHHFGILTDEIESVVQKMKDDGVPFRKDITDLGFWNYVMVPAPDDILIELFQVDTTELPADLVEYFEGS